MLLSKRSEHDYAVYHTVVSAPEVEVQLRVPAEDTALDIVPSPVDIPKCGCIVADRWTSNRYSAQRTKLRRGQRIIGIGVACRHTARRHRLQNVVVGVIGI